MKDKEDINFGTLQAHVHKWKFRIDQEENMIQGNQIELAYLLKTPTELNRSFAAELFLILFSIFHKQNLLSL